MARPQKRETQKQEKRTADDPRWDRMHGAAKDGRMARDVEKSSGRYSASEQGEEKQPRTPTAKE